MNDFKIEIERHQLQILVSMLENFLFQEVENFDRVQKIEFLSNKGLLFSLYERAAKRYYVYRKIKAFKLKVTEAEACCFIANYSEMPVKDNQKFFAPQIFELFDSKI